MHVKPSEARTIVTDYLNGNKESISTDKTKETEKMVQMFSNESVEEIDDDDVCLIEDSPVKVNGKHDREDIATVTEATEENIKIEQMEVDATPENVKIEDVHDDEDEIVDESCEKTKMNGNEIASSSNKPSQANHPSTESIVTVAEQVPNTIDSNSEVSVPTVQSVAEETDEIVTNTIPNHKRSRSASPTDEAQPTKRLRTELEKSFVGHNKRVQEYIEKTSNNSIDEITNQIEGLYEEVRDLQALADEKERDWNNILYLKKVKEEIICRLTRKKTVLEITSTRVGEVQDYTILEQQPSISQKITRENRNSASHSQSAYSRIPNYPLTETAKMINNRATMTSSELHEERGTSAKMHRYVIWAAIYTD